MTVAGRRPALERRSDVAWALRFLGIVGAIGAAGWMLWRYPTLPDQVIAHLDATGRPDAMGSKSTGFLIVVGMALLTVAVAELSRHPRVFNYPVYVTEGNAQRLYRAGEITVAALTPGLALVGWGIVLTITATTVYGVGGFGFLLAGLAVVVVAAVVGVVAMVRGA